MPRRSWARRLLVSGERDGHQSAQMSVGPTTAICFREDGGPGFPRRPWARRRTLGFQRSAQTSVGPTNIFCFPEDGKAPACTPVPLSLSGNIIFAVGPTDVYAPRSLSLFLSLSRAKKAHKHLIHKLFLLPLVPGLSQGQTRFVPGTNWASTV